MIVDALACPYPQSAFTVVAGASCGTRPLSLYAAAAQRPHLHSLDCRAVEYCESVEYCKIRISLDCRATEYCETVEYREFRISLDCRAIEYCKTYETYQFPVVARRSIVHLVSSSLLHGGEYEQLRDLCCCTTQYCTLVIETCLV